jgi:hypothetical protein
LREQGPRPSVDCRQTPSSLLGFPNPTELEKHKDIAIDTLPRTDTFGSDASIRRRSTRSTSTRPGHRNVLENSTNEVLRHSFERTYDDDQLRKIAKRVSGGRWRRWGYPLSIVILWILWLTAFRKFDYVSKQSSTDTSNLKCSFTERYLGSPCRKRAARIRKEPIFSNTPQLSSSRWLQSSRSRSSSTTTLNGYLDSMSRILSSGKSMLTKESRRLRRVFDFNRSGSLYTRFMLPGVFSGFVFTLW